MRLNWNAVSSADTYHIYYATEANIQPANIAAFDNGTWVENVSPPYEITGLTNGTTYYFVVTAIDGSLETEPSAEVSTRPSSVDLARQPTTNEVLVLELVNRARFDPLAEAQRYGIDLNKDNLGPPISAEQKPPLAFNLYLIDAARAHSQWMIDVDVFNHLGVGGSQPWDRMAAAGYSFTGLWTAAENIAWWGGTGNSINLTQAAYRHHESLFLSAGHRVNILNAGFREIGIGQKEGYFMSEGRNLYVSMLTEKFARSGSSYFLTGVVYQDLDGDGMYSAGEGLSGITLTVNGQPHLVYDTGAYSIPVSNGTHTITASGTALGTPVEYTLTVSGANVKFDVIKSGNAVSVNTW